MDKSWMTIGKTPDGRLSHPYIEGVINWKNVDVATRDVVLQNIAVNLH